MHAKTLKALGTTVLAAVVLSVSGTADAATVGLMEDDFDHVLLVGGPGEANNVTVADPDTEAASGEVQITDTGAPLTAGPGCVAVDAHRVTCRSEYWVELRLGDGDDRLESTREIAADGG